MTAPLVEIKTTMGTFVLELYVDHAPRTVQNFIELSKKGYYDGTLVSASTCCLAFVFPACVRYDDSLCSSTESYGTL